MSRPAAHSRSPAPLSPMPSFLTLVSLTLLACSSPLAVGEECSDSADCMEGLSCFFSSSDMSQSVCMSDCDDTTMRLCAGGEVCIPAASMGVPREAEVCFLGGATEIGSPCADSLACVRGALCVVTGTDQVCARACSTDDGSACAATETCEALAGMGTKGFCAAAP